MKSFAALLVLSATLFASAAAAPSEDSASVPPKCFWDGTAPFCAGICPPGYTGKEKSSCGDGACCWAGYKEYCCRE